MKVGDLVRMAPTLWPPSSRPKDGGLGVIIAVDYTFEEETWDYQVFANHRGVGRLFLADEYDLSIEE